MSGKAQRKAEIQELLLYGYTYQEISQKLGISERTVARDVRKLRDGSKHWLEEIVDRDLVSSFKEGMDGFKKDMSVLKDMLDTDSVKANLELKLRIIKAISEARLRYLNLLLHAPTYWAFESIVKSCERKPISYSGAKSLGGISGMIR